MRYDIESMITIEPDGETAALEAAFSFHCKVVRRFRSVQAKGSKVKTVVRDENGQVVQTIE